jgi:hypothetical protein
MDIFGLGIEASGGHELGSDIEGVGRPGNPTGISYSKRSSFGAGFLVHAAYLSCGLVATVTIAPWPLRLKRLPSGPACKGARWVPRDGNLS